MLLMWGMGGGISLALPHLDFHIFKCLRKICYFGFQLYGFYSGHTDYVDVY